MSCTGTPAPPGLKYESDPFSASSSQLRVECAGGPTSATVVALGGGQYKVRVPAIDVACPGPIEVFDGTTRVYCAKVEPC